MKLQTGWLLWDGLPWRSAENSSDCWCCTGSGMTLWPLTAVPKSSCPRRNNHAQGYTVPPSTTVYHKCSFFRTVTEWWSWKHSLSTVPHSFQDKAVTDEQDSIKLNHKQSLKGHPMDRCTCTSIYIIYISTKLHAHHSSAKSLSLMVFDYYRRRKRSI